jgi:hypothetical protein
MMEGILQGLQKALKGEVYESLCALDGITLQTLWLAWGCSQRQYATR